MVIFVLDLVLEHVVPGTARESHADKKLEDVERNVCNNAVDPDNSSPFPSNSIDSSKVPVCIHSNDSCHLG